MDKNAKTFWDMINGSVSFARLYEYLWIKYGFIKLDIEGLESISKEISEYYNQQNDSNTSGQVAQKNQNLIALGEETYIIGRALCHLAKSTNNLVLLAAADVPKTGLIKGEEKDIISKIKSMLNLARTNIKDLAAYDVTVEMLNEKEEKLNKISAMPTTIVHIKSKRKTAKRSITELIAAARILLDLLDDAFVAVIRDEKFINGWFDARKIKGRHSAGKKNNDNGNNPTPPAK
jgi:hypothetical protein